MNNILAIIPVLNEEATIARVISSLQAYGLTNIRVVDNGSSDRSATEAQAAGAEVLFEPVSGYGRACYSGLQNLPAEIEWLLFCDGDGSDDFTCLPEFFRLRDRYDLILGDRRSTPQGKSALTPVQNFGNGLASWLIGWGWGHWYGDLGPLRLIRRSALAKIAMQDRGMGWTVEMQVRAIEEKLRIVEIPVIYHSRQGGQSKISGTISGSIQAGVIILTTLGKLYWRHFQHLVRAEIEKREKFWQWLSGILLLLGTILILPHGDFRQPEAVPQFWSGIAVMSGGFVLSWILPSVNFGYFWSIAIVTRLILLPMYPGDDVWRYLWEGYIQILGFSPYDLAPKAVELMPYRTEWWSLINHQGVSAIYPPITQLGFRSLAMITPHFIIFKTAFISADLLVCWLLTRKFSYSQSTLYAWNPLVIYSFAGGAHYDSWFILPLVAAWFLYESQPEEHNRKILNWLKSALLIGVATAIKWISLPILGFLAWQAWRKASFHLSLLVLICGILPLLLTALPFCSPDSCPLIPTSSTFVSHGRSAEFIPYLLSQVWQPAVKSNAIFALPLGIAVLFLLIKTLHFQQFSEGYFFALLTISPIIHAWYFTWIIPFAVATQNWGVRLVSLSGFIYFALPYRQGLGINTWYLNTTERLWLWLPFIVGYLVLRRSSK